MTITYERLDLLKVAERNADQIWEIVGTWRPFERDVVGRQLVRAADSIGANLAESLGRYHYGERLRFLYYARGSLFETKYWLNRALARGLLAENQGRELIAELTTLARQLNAFARTIKRNQRPQAGVIDESNAKLSAESKSSQDPPAKRTQSQ